jgi:hypothetical protein
MAAPEQIESLVLVLVILGLGYTKELTTSGAEKQPLNTVFTVSINVAGTISELNKVNEIGPVLGVVDAVYPVNLLFVE